MAAELTMPKLSDSEADAVIIKWLKSPGEEFRRGEALIEVETDKATVVYDAEADGTLESILVPEGEAAAVGQPIAVLAGAGETVAPQEPAQLEATRSNGAPVADRPNASPVARRTALELGLSLHGIDGTGPGGRITREDVQRAAGADATARRGPTADGRGDVSVVELTPTQSTIARRMTLRPRRSRSSRSRSTPTCRRASRCGSPSRIRRRSTTSS
jgi:pyruvate dehydrogenase E2 component (dihydrolipoamide acetyltransferase)